MFVYYNPLDGNQVMAMYSEFPLSTYWLDEGYVLATVSVNLASQIGLDCKVSVPKTGPRMGQVIRVSASDHSSAAPVDPGVLRRGELLSKFRDAPDLVITSEVAEYLGL